MPALFRLPSISFIILSSLTLFATSVKSQQPDFLKWREVNLKFEDNISIIVKTDGINYQHFQIIAFNKEFLLEKEQLRQIEGLSLSLLNVEREGGIVGDDKIYDAVIFNLSNYTTPSKDSTIKLAKIVVTRLGVSIMEETLNVTQPQPQSKE
jgi:hypothetical protein